MSDLSEIDKQLLETVKRNIESKAGLSESDNLSQKDYDFLQYFIEERTGEALSLTTIKRIWKNDFQRLPHLSTLDILSKIACDQDWFTARKYFVEKGILRKEMPAVQGVGSDLKSGRKLRMRIGGVLVIFALGAAALYYLPSLTPVDASDVVFIASPTVDLQVPNSVVFSYDVAGCRASHFYIQQSWDPARKVEVSASNSKQTDIYYEPGYHYAKLLADDQVLKEIPVHIRYNDWFVRVRYPDSRLIKISEENLERDGHLGLTPSYAKKLGSEERFQLGYMLSKDFEFSADELQLDALIRFDSVNTAPCPSMHLLIKGTASYAWITMGLKGCESNYGLIFGNAHVDGKTNDLTPMAMEAFTWQRVVVKASDGKFQLYVNDDVAYEGRYTEQLGDLKEVDFFFNGIGSIDEINLSDSKDTSLMSHNFN